MEEDSDGTFNIAIMHVVNTGKLWVSEPSGKNMSGQRLALQQLEENLSNLMRGTFEMPFNLPVNKLIAVKNEATGCWHRGELLSPRPTSSSCTVRVFLVDHGAVLVDVKPKHLQILPEEMQQLPKQAFIVCLYGLIPVSVNVHLEDTSDKMHYEECLHWTQASETFVRKYLKAATSAHLSATLCRGHVVHGEVILNIHGKGYVSLNEELVKNNFAIYSKTKYEEVIKREAKLEEKFGTHFLEVNENVKINSISPKTSTNLKPTLMEDFLKEYTDKKKLRQANNIQLLEAARYKKEMRGCVMYDEKERKEIKDTIFASRAKTIGRGGYLSHMKSEYPPVSVGRGFPLSIKVDKTSSQPKEIQAENSSSLNPFDILSVNKADEHSRDSTRRWQDSSVVSLGCIPAGYSSNTEDLENLYKMDSVVKKRHSKLSEGKSSDIRKSCVTSPEFMHGAKKSDQKKSRDNVSSNNADFLDPEFFLDSKKTVSSKILYASDSSTNKEADANSGKTAKESIITTKAGTISAVSGSKIMKFLFSQSRSSGEGKTDVISKDAGGLSDEGCSTMLSAISHERSCRSKFIDKNGKSVEYMGQSMKFTDYEKEEKPLHTSTSSNENKENSLSSKKKKSNPLQSLFEALKNKPKADKDVFEDASCINVSFSETIPPALTSTADKPPVSSRMKDCDNFLHSEVYPSGEMALKRNLELMEERSPERQTERANFVSYESDNNNKSQKDDQISGRNDLGGDCGIKFSSHPDQVKDALNLISNFISSIDSKDSLKPPVDLIRLQRELNIFSHHVISKDKREFNMSGNDASTPIASKDFEGSLENDFHVDNETFVDTKHEEIDHPDMSLEISKLSEDNGFIGKDEGRVMSCIKDQLESKELLEVQKSSLGNNEAMGIRKIDAAIKETKHDRNPETVSNIKNIVPKSEPFSLLRFFPQKRHTVKSEDNKINHEKNFGNIPKSDDVSHDNSTIATASEEKVHRAFLSSEGDNRKLNVKEGKSSVSVSEENISRELHDADEMNQKSDKYVLNEKNYSSYKDSLDDDHISKNISSCSKILQKMEQNEKKKCLQVIKDEGIPMVKLTARLPSLAALRIQKSEGSPVSSFNDELDYSTQEDGVPKISEQIILEPEAVTLCVPKAHLPSLLMDSWSSEYSSDDCLLIHKRQKMCRVLVRGPFLSQRINSIAQATFSKVLHEALDKMGFRDLMRIQTYAWPALMRGHDLVMVNPPRSGKTLGYLVPLLSFMLSPELYSELPAGNGPLVLIICPSWKVVSQVNEFCESLVSNSIRVISTYGGIEAEQTVSLINGCHVLISTPRCFLRLLRQDRITTSLDRLCHLVLDDADILMKLFSPEIKEILRECRLTIQRRARIAAESNPSVGATSYAMVKLVVSSKSWCPQMESFVTNIIDKPVIFIGSYLEAAVYAQLKPKLHLVGYGVDMDRNEEEKIHSLERVHFSIHDIVLYIIKRTLGLYKTVIACESKVEALQMASKMCGLDAHVVVIHEDVLHVDIAEFLYSWSHSKPGAYPVLIVTDEALPEVNIGDAEHLIHVGIPSSSKTQFGLRFSTLMDNYRNIFDKASDITNCNKNCLVDIIVDIKQPNLELAGLIEFMQRLGMKIPKELEAAATKSQLNKENIKKKDIELCQNLKSFGECISSSCNFRHVISPELDKPKDVPLSGEVCVKVLHVLDASHMSVRLLEHTSNNGIKTIYPNEYYMIAAQMAKYFGKSQNHIAYGNPKVGDLCAYETEINLFHRARVEKILYSESKVKIPVGVSIKLIDTGINVKARMFQLFYLPDSLKGYPEQAKEMIVSSMLPRDLDSSWSKAASVKVAEWIEEESKGESNGKIMVGKVVLALGNTIWVDPLECREWLRKNKTNIIHLSLPLNLCQAGLAIRNPEHIVKLQQICKVAGMSLNLENFPIENQDPINEFKSPSANKESEMKTLSKWETLDQEKIVEVQVVCVDSPSCFTIQKVDAEDKLKYLMEEIQSWVSDVWQKSCSSDVFETKEYSTNSFCLGYFEKSECWNRAKILSVQKETSKIPSCKKASEEADTKITAVQYQLYFLDFGDSATVSCSEIAPIPETLINKLPFQAIECSLMGVKPLYENLNENSYAVKEWTEEAGDVLYALCREGDDSDIYRILLAKVFEIEGEGTFGGPKYSVALFDKGESEGPISFSKLLIEKGLAISCRNFPDNEVDDEVNDELASHWLGEGALLPFSHSLELSEASRVVSENTSVEIFENNVKGKAESSNPCILASRLLSSDEDDDDSYDIVMSDDEIKLYEENLREFLGIPPSGGYKRIENQHLALESSATVKETSSYGMLTPTEVHSSSFEDLGNSHSEANDTFEEIEDDISPEDGTYKAIDERGCEDIIEVSSECHESFDSNKTKKDSKCVGKLEEDDKNRSEESCLAIKTDCKGGEDLKEYSGHCENFSVEIKNPTLISDETYEIQYTDVIIHKNNNKTSGKVPDTFNCRNTSDSFAMKNSGKNNDLIGIVTEAEVSDCEIERNGECLLTPQIMITEEADLLNIEERVDLEINKPVCDEIVSEVENHKKPPNCSNKVTKILDGDERTFGNDSTYLLHNKHLICSSDLSQHNVEEYFSLDTKATMECSTRVDENHLIEKLNNGDVDFQLYKTLQEDEGNNNFDLKNTTDELENPVARFPFPVATEVTTRTDVLEDFKETDDISCRIDAKISTDKTCDSLNKECISMPRLIKSKTPSVKWAQSKVQIILTIGVPSTTRYQVHWITNRKFNFFALSDDDIECRFALEMELWGYVDTHNSQVAAISDNAVRMILSKSFAYTEWPHLLLSGIRPMWLSVDFDAMEFDSEENSEEDFCPVVKYNESEEEYSTDEDDASVNGQRIEEINYDPYDPLS